MKAPIVFIEKVAISYERYTKALASRMKNLAVLKPIGQMSPRQDSKSTIKQLGNIANHAENIIFNLDNNAYRAGKKISDVSDDYMQIMEHARKMTGYYN